MKDCRAELSCPAPASTVGDCGHIARALHTITEQATQVELSKLHLRSRNVRSRPHQMHDQMLRLGGEKSLDVIEAAINAYENNEDPNDYA